MSDSERTLYCLLGSYAVTGVLLFTAMFFGHKKRVKSHIAMIGLFLVGFVITLYFAETLGRVYFNFEEQRKKIHLPLAYVATGATLLPLATGWRKWRGSGSLFAHRAAIFGFLAPFVLASATGVWMLLSKTPK